MIKVKKVEPPHKPKYFLFVMRTDDKRITRIYPVPYKVQINLEKLKKIIENATTKL